MHYSFTITPVRDLVIDRRFIFRQTSERETEVVGLVSDGEFSLLARQTHQATVEVMAASLYTSLFSETTLP
jgi:hypothetical protein